MTNLAFIDCETTGLDPERHAVWEIGLIVDNKEFSWIIQLTEQEMYKAEPMALSVGNYYERAGKAFSEYVASRGFGVPPMPPNDTFPESEQEMWQAEQEVWQGHTFITQADRAQLADFLARTINRSHLVGAVPSFDARFVGDFMRTHNRVPAWHYHLVDVEALAAGKLGREPLWRSKDLYREIGVNPEAFAEHTALGDARMARSVYERIFVLKPSYPESWYNPLEVVATEGSDH